MEKWLLNDKVIKETEPWNTTSEYFSSNETWNKESLMIVLIYNGSSEHNQSRTHN